MIKSVLLSLLLAALAPISAGAAIYDPVKYMGGVPYIGTLSFSGYVDARAVGLSSHERYQARFYITNDYTDMVGGNTYMHVDMDAPARAANEQLYAGGGYAGSFSDHDMFSAWASTDVPGYDSGILLPGYYLDSGTVRLQSRRGDMWASRTDSLLAESFSIAFSFVVFDSAAPVLQDSGQRRTLRTRRFDQASFHYLDAETGAYLTRNVVTPTAVPLPFPGAMLVGGMAALAALRRRPARRA